MKTLHYYSLLPVLYLALMAWVVICQHRTDYNWYDNMETKEQAYDDQSAIRLSLSAYNMEHISEPTYTSDDNGFKALLTDLVKGNDMPATNAVNILNRNNRRGKLFHLYVIRPTGKDGQPHTDITNLQMEQDAKDIQLKEEQARKALGL
jgi:hypothetical protein